jgi:hypothetical protein
MKVTKNWIFFFVYGSNFNFNEGEKIPNLSIIRREFLRVLELIFESRKRNSISID